MIAKNKIIQIFFCIMILVVPISSYGIYNLGPLYIIKISNLIFQTFGGTLNPSTGIVTNKFFSYPSIGSIDGYLRRPTSVAIDGANDFFYVANYEGHNVQKYVLSTGAFVGAIGNSLTATGTCVAGKQNGWCVGGVFTFDSYNENGFINNPDAIAIDVVNDYLYVLSSVTGSVQRFVLSTGAFAGFIGYANYPAGTCVTGSQSGWCVGATNTTPSRADGAFGGPGSYIAFTLDTVNGYMYVASQSLLPSPIANKVQKFNLTTGAFIGAIGYSTGGGTCVAGAQTTWCTGGGTTFSSLGTGDGMFDSIISIAVDPAGDKLYVLSDSRVQQFVASTGAFVGAIGKSTASGTCVSGAQSAWCTGGSFSSGTGLDGQFSGAQSVGIDPGSNRMYITQYSFNSIQQFNLSTGAYISTTGYSPSAAGTCTMGNQSSWCTGGVFATGTATSGDGRYSGSKNIAMDLVNGSIFVTDSNNNRVQKYTLSTGALNGSFGGYVKPATTWTSAVTASSAVGDGVFHTARFTAVDPAGDLMYVIDPLAYRLNKLTLSTGAFIGSIGFSEIAGGTCSAGVQSGWCVGGSFVSDPAASDGSLTFSFGAGATIVAIDTVNNRLYVNSLYKIQKFNLATGAFIGTIGKSTAAGTCSAGAQSSWCTGGTFSAGTGDGMFGASISGIKLDVANDLLYVADNGNYRVQKFTLSTGAFIGAIGKSTAAGTCVAGAQTAWCSGGSFSTGSVDGTFSNPQGLDIDVGNNLMYVGDGSRIQKFTLSTGAFVGAIGKSTASGTCVAGAQSAWCTGGVFSAATTDGAFSTVGSIVADTSKNFLYVTDNGNRIQKINLSAGSFVGSVGKATATSGTCVVGVQTKWCTGGTFGGAATNLPGEVPAQSGLALDSVNSYLFETYGNRVQRITLP